MSKAPTEEIIRKVLNKTRDIVSADRASLFLVDRRKKELWSKIADNTPEIRVKMGAGIVGAVATTGEPLNVPDAYRDARFNKKIDMATGYRTRQILCLPIKNQRSQVVGVVQCINKKRGGHAFTMDDEERLNELCFQCASGKADNCCICGRPGMAAPNPGCCCCCCCAGGIMCCCCGMP